MHLLGATQGCLVTIYQAGMIADWKNSPRNCWHYELQLLFQSELGILLVPCQPTTSLIFQMEKTNNQIKRI